jgi:hypothetical protein
LAKGLIFAFLVPSGGSGMSQLPSVDTKRAISKKAPRHTGSRHEFDIMEPFHSSKMLLWQVAHAPGLPWPENSLSYGGGCTFASSVL